MPHDDPGQNLNKLRKEIDKIDKQIMALFSQRTEKIRRVGRVKKKSDLPLYDANRWHQMMKDRLAGAEKYGLSEKFIRQIWNILHESALEIEKKV